MQFVVFHSCSTLTWAWILFQLKHCKTFPLLPNPFTLCLLFHTPPLLVTPSLQPLPSPLLSSASCLSSAPCPTLSHSPGVLALPCLSDVVVFLNSRRDCRAPTIQFSLTCGAWACPWWSWRSAATPSPHQTPGSWRPFLDVPSWTGQRENLTPTWLDPDHRAGL